MLSSIVHDTPPSVKTRPYRITCGGRAYWLSVLRTCGHDDLIPDEPGGYEFASRPDIPCAQCRRQTDRTRAVPSLIGQPYADSRGRASAGRRPTRPSTHPRRRPRRTFRQRQIRDALTDFNAALDFLAEIENGQRTATDHAITHARTVGAQALRRLRQLGAAV